MSVQSLLEAPRPLVKRRDLAQERLGQLVTFELRDGNRMLDATVLQVLAERLFWVLGRLIGISCHGERRL